MCDVSEKLMLCRKRQYVGSCFFMSIGFVECLKNWLVTVDSMSFIHMMLIPSIILFGCAYGKDKFDTFSINYLC